GLGLVILSHIVRTGRLKALASVGVPMAASLLLFAVFDYRYFGTLLPNGGYLSIRESQPQFWLTPQIGFLGLLLDRGYGLLPVAPVYLLAIVGIFRPTNYKWESAALLVPALVYIAF